MDGNRSFTIERDSFGYNSGRYVAATPAAAAKHAGRMCFLLAKQGKNGLASFKNVDSVTVALFETTRGSAHKTFYYNITRTKSSQPFIMRADGKKINIGSVYKYRVISVDPSEFTDA